jgi:NADPH-dependent 2,4-dienoyl-CoA reductase/sulfur reductase-like enzyme/rhodanese-related sulfurtransferase
MKVCIVGGVAGGATAAARLRRLNEKAQIIMFERGEYISFANCGLPYHISGAIEEREALLLQTPASFHGRYLVDVRTQHEVTAINKERKTLTVKKLSGGELYEESYDYLILSPGAYPFVPPMELATGAQYFTLRDIPDLDRIMQRLTTSGVSSALVIGGGFIGIEVAENLIERGLETHLVELSPQVLAPLDQDMANILHRKMRDKGIKLHLGDAVAKLTPDSAEMKSGAKIPCGICIAAVGVKPDAKLAAEAGLTVGATGGIVVDETMRTSDPAIFAVGDAVEIQNPVTGMSGLIALAGPANRQARIAADNIAGLDSRYHGTQGTGIVKVFDLTAAFTGITEKAAKKMQLAYEAIHLHPFHHATYYPKAQQMHLKVIFEKGTGRLLGAQAVGRAGVDKRIDVLATALRANMRITDLENLELCYAPPFGSAKDAVNMAGFIGSNIMKGITRSVTYDRLDELGNYLVLNVCHPEEWDPAVPPIPQSTTIPLPQLRTRLGELPRDRPLVISCYAGLRGHIACRILMQSGFDNVYNLSGGYLTYLDYMGY